MKIGTVYEVNLNEKMILIRLLNGIVVKVGLANKSKPDIENLLGKMVLVKILPGASESQNIVIRIAKN